MYFLLRRIEDGFFFFEKIEVATSFLKINCHFLNIIDINLCIRRQKRATASELKEPSKSAIIEPHESELETSSDFFVYS